MANLEGFRYYWNIRVQAGVAQLAEHQLPKLRVAGSNPVSRSFESKL